MNEDIIKYCPFKKDVACLKEHCAIWGKECEKCAILAIASNLHSLRLETNEMSKVLGSLERAVEYNTRLNQ